MTLGLGVTFENFQTLPVLAYFFTLKSSTETNSGIHQNEKRSRCLITPLYLTSSPVVTNQPNKTLIFHYFQGPKIKFHDFPGPENEIRKFRDLPGLP